MLLKTLYDASYSVIQGVGARRVGDVRRVGRCRGPTRRKIPISTVVKVSPYFPPVVPPFLSPCWDPREGRGEVAILPTHGPPR